MITTDDWLLIIREFSIYTFTHLHCKSISYYLDISKLIRNKGGYELTRNSLQKY